MGEYLLLLALLRGQRGRLLLLVVVRLRLGLTVTEGCISLR